MVLESQNCTPVNTFNAETPRRVQSQRNQRILEPRAGGSSPEQLGQPRCFADGKAEAQRVRSYPVTHTSQRRGFLSSLARTLPAPLALPEADPGAGAGGPGRCRQALLPRGFLMASGLRCTPSTPLAPAPTPQRCPLPTPGQCPRAVLAPHPSAMRGRYQWAEAPAVSCYQQLPGNDLAQVPLHPVAFPPEQLFHSSCPGPAPT